MTSASDHREEREEADCFLAAVKRRCDQAVVAAPVARPAETLLHVGGKQLRARLLWWSAKATANRDVRPDDPTLVQAAAAIELAHLGSLLHDDIVDGAESRRGVATLHRERGPRVAADAGAAIAHLASMLFAPLGQPTRHAVRRATLALCRGQVRELARAFIIVSPRERVAIMQEKTAALFELTAGVGAALAGADRGQRAAIKCFARRFGVAFQIADDVLDLVGDPAELGRSNGADLREGVMTLPMLLAAARDSRLVTALTALQRSSTADAIADCAALVVRFNGIAEASSVARWWLGRGLAALDGLAASAARDALRELARSSVARGLTPGPADHAASPVATPSALLAHSMIRGPSSAACRDVARRLTRSLDWILPGLSSVVEDLDTRTAASCSRLERTLLRGRDWSHDARIAASAIALAYALAHDDALRCDPVRTIAVADCLHCLAIATLCDGDEGEHERMAARAQVLQPYATATEVADRSEYSGFERQPTASLNV